MSTAPINYSALAQQSGAIDSTPPPQQVQSAGTDYNAMANQSGAIDIPQDSKPQGEGAPIQPVTRSTNPKLNIAASGENMPEYVGATGAIGAGLMGAAETGGALNAGARALAPAATRGVVGIGQWAAEHPMTAKVVWEGLKLAFYGKLVRSAGKVIDAAPDR